MQFALVVRHRLKALSLDQRDLAVAAEVTESYVSQLLAGKKTPPAPERSDIYTKFEAVLQLPSGELSRLAQAQRIEDLKRKISNPPQPLFKDFRSLVLAKCVPERRNLVRDIFEKETFGEIERLVTQKLLDVAKGVASEELQSESWLRMIARLSRRSYQDMRVRILEFLDTDVFHVTVENCVAFLEPLIESWDIDLETFGMEIALNHRLTLGHLKRFEFVEREPQQPRFIEPGFEEFLRDPILSANITDEEIEFLKSLEFRNRRPTALYYYRELQNLRDPLHFDSVPTPPSGREARSAGGPDSPSTPSRA
ncbi:MAG: XRE family transcriptional regulator [Acidobacteria bacterium]|nr:XRE family transcriptional regulator [Acidobacteriota bacterium]